ncbi:MAG TPA: HU family DNA-binding protein [Nocardioides sp.]|nr:HU family DNA-binding protein [Nocardioides sp.]
MCQQHGAGHPGRARAGRSTSSRSTMKKDQIVQSIADASGVSKADADRVLSAVVDTITGTVASGEKIQIPGLGTFESRDRSAREGRNPQTGETIQIAATRVPGFKPAASFKQATAGK